MIRTLLEHCNDYKQKLSLRWQTENYANFILSNDYVNVTLNRTDDYFLTRGGQKFETI